MQSKLRISVLLFAFVAAAFSPVLAEPVPNGNGVLRSGDNGSVRALIIGIDAYRHVKPLKGAVADARDIESALKRRGVQDITALIDLKADRAAILSSINNLLGRVGPRDLVILLLPATVRRNLSGFAGLSLMASRMSFCFPALKPQGQVHSSVFLAPSSTIFSSSSKRAARMLSS